MEQFTPAVRERMQQALDAVEARPRDPQANGRWGMVLHAHGQHQAAAVAYQRAHLLDTGKFDWLYFLGVVQAADGSYDQAAATLRRALRKRPDYVPAQLKLAECLLSAGKPGEAATVYAMVLEQQPSSAEAHYGLGRVHAARREWDAAVTSFRKACEMFPSYGAAHYALALAYRNQGNQDQAQAVFSNLPTGRPESGST